MFLLSFGNDDDVLMKATILGDFSTCTGFVANTELFFLKLIMFKTYNQIYNKSDTKWTLSFHKLSRWKVASNYYTVQQGKILGMGYLKRFFWKYIWKQANLSFCCGVLSTPTWEFPLFKILFYVLRLCFWDVYFNYKKLASH